MANEREVKKLISSVLCSAPTAVTIGQLNKDFQNIVGFQLPFKNFGHPTLESYLRTLPDVCEVRGSGNHAILIHVVPDSLEHINSMINKQKVSSNNKKRINYPRPRGIKRYIPWKPQSNFFNLNNNWLEDNDTASISSSSCQCDSEASTSNTNDQTNTNKYSKTLRYYSKIWKASQAQKNNDLNSVSSSTHQIIKDRLQNIVKQHRTGLRLYKLPDIYRKIYNKELDPYEFKCSCVSELCGQFNNEIFHMVKINSEMILLDINLPKPNPEDYEENNPYDTLEYPTDVMILGSELGDQEIYCGYTISDYVPVTVLHINDLSNFYYRYNFNKDFLLRRNLFFDELQDYYLKNSNKYIIATKHILVGLYCAVLVEDTIYRAIITNQLSKDVEVFLVDVGEITVVEQNHLFYLKIEFKFLGKQAICASLSCLKPVNSNTWSRESIFMFSNMTKGKKCVGKITSINETFGKMNVILIDVTDDNVDIIINDTLIDEGYAEVK